MFYVIQDLAIPLYLNFIKKIADPRFVSKNTQKLFIFFMPRHTLYVKGNFQGHGVNCKQIPAAVHWV